VESQRVGLPVSPWIGPIGQLEQQVCDEGSALWQHQPAFVWLALRLEDVHRYLAEEAETLGPARTAERIAACRLRLVALAKGIRSRSQASVLVSNFGSPALVANLFSAGDADGLGHLVAAENRELARDLAEISGAHVLDYAGLVGELGRPRFYDLRLGYLARAAASAEGHRTLSRSVARAAAALSRPPAKCLVLDLDHTLWGGVLGEDGPLGVEVGEDHPGNVYKDRQAWVLSQRSRGVLLAVASKNDEGDVRAALARKDMLLHAEHFSCIEAGWDPKARMLERIAERLRIGLDALVFVDDDPVERAHVRAALPLVHVVELPSEPADWLSALGEVEVLDRPRVLDEDRHRAAAVHADTRRAADRASVATVAEFLAGLEMVAEVGLAGPQTLPRIHQLVHKTNQFNLTARRHSLETLTSLAAAPDARVAWLRLRDRFGDMGLVCAGVLRQREAATWEIDTLLMSCRVMGRQIDDALLAYLCELVLAAGGCRLWGVLQKTAKNQPVLAFYPDRGFRARSQPSAESVFEKTLTATDCAWPSVVLRRGPGETEQSPAPRGRP
jgi:FkbH-like protein